MTPWWRHHFGDAWFALHADLFGEERSRQETSAILALLGLPLGARVLDVPCGWGRHTSLLTAAGLRATGADLSWPLLARAREAGLRSLACADIALLPFADGVFDAVLDLFTSVGLFDDDDREVAALSELRRVLASGGRLLLETAHRDDVARGFAPRDRLTLANGTRVRIRRRFDPLTGIAEERWRWRTPGGEEGKSAHRIRVYTAGEVEALLRRAGFEVLEVLGNWDGAPFDLRSPRMIVRAGVR